MRINNIAIIGGGSAGWLTANYLGAALSTMQGMSITLIESPDVPIVGVGEGTVPAMRETLKHFGIRETDFVRDCDVAFKQSIKFVNWLDQDKHGKDNYYHHLFDYPFPFGDDLTPYWLSEKQSRNYADIVSVQGAVCDAGLAPKKIATPEYEGETTYAYHMNAAKFAKLLGRNAKEKFSVQHMITNVVDVNLDNDGFIKSLTTDTKGELAFDFYIDCTGFAAYLLGQKMNVPYLDKSDVLFTNTALVAQITKEPDSTIPPYTIATAHQAGWTWDIHLPMRRGVGFVYSNNHMSDGEAEDNFAQYLGSQAPDSFRKLSMPVGRREKFWSKNCVAIGLSQGFAEPLEATAILLSDYSAKLLAGKFPRDKAECKFLENRFNKAMVYGWERVFDFIKMHYCVSNREDTQFWRDNKAPQTMSDNLKDQLALWKNHSPSPDDFFSKFEIFDVENYLYVLYGMQYPTQNKPLNQSYVNMAEQQFAAVGERAQALLKELPRHRDLLDKIKQYGMQPL